MTRAALHHENDIPINEASPSDLAGLLRPDLLIVKVHEVAPVRLGPSFYPAGQDEGLDILLADLIQVVLHPVGGPGPSAVRAAFSSVSRTPMSGGVQRCSPQ